MGFFDIFKKTRFAHRVFALSPTPVDLSGAAATQYLFHAEKACTLKRATIVYTEASSADAGVALKLGNEGDEDAYYAGDSESGKAQYYENTVTLLSTDIDKGDTIIFTSAGGKTGTGEIIVSLEIEQK